MTWRQGSIALLAAVVVLGPCAALVPVFARALDVTRGVASVALLATLADTLRAAATATAAVAPIALAGGVRLRTLSDGHPARRALACVATTPGVVLGVLPALAASWAFGAGTMAVAAVLAAVALPAALLATEEALAAAPVDLEEAARALGASEAQTFARVTWPAARRRLAAVAVRTFGQCVAEGAALALVLRAMTARAPTLATRLWTLDLRGDASVREAVMVAAALGAVSIAVALTAEGLRDGDA